MSAVQYASSSLLPLPLLPGIPSLHYLSQAYNALMSVPPAVGGYSQLAVLDLAGNAIEVLPDGTQVFNQQAPTSYRSFLLPNLYNPPNN